MRKLKPTWNSLKKKNKNIYVSPCESDLDLARDVEENPRRCGRNRGEWSRIVEES